MRKHQTLLTALALLLCSAVAAQAQNLLYEVKVFTTPTDARAGGENEMSGGVLLNFEPNPSGDVTVTLDYSVPLAGDIMSARRTSDSVGLTTSLATNVEGEAENDDNDDNGTITITDITAGENLLIRGVMLDVSGASDDTVTVTVKVTSSNDTDFIRIDGPSSATVIEDILVGVDAEADTEIIRTRGTDMDGITATLTLEESFKGAFMMGNMLEIEFSGIPEGASLAAAVTNNPVDIEGDSPDAFPTSPYAVVEGVKDGVVTVRLGGMDAETPQNEARTAPGKVVLALTLTADPGDDDADISFPLDVGSIMAKVTFTGEAADAEGSFRDAFTDYETVFNINPAQCELLFPVVTVLEMGASMWDTAISVTNPAFAGEMGPGALTFTFYGQDATVAEYQTSAGSPGSGLSADGTLAAGGTYQVMASQILADTDWGTSFVGHVHLLADYTECSGLGWVTDFMTVNQAYTATVIDADTGM